MRDFTLFVQDERYSVPTVVFVTLADALGAAQLARTRLEESAYHLAIDLHEGEDHLARVDREGVIWLRAPPEQ